MDQQTMACHKSNGMSLGDYVTSLCYRLTHTHKSVSLAYTERLRLASALKEPEKVNCPLWGRPCGSGLQAASRS